MTKPPINEAALALWMARYEARLRECMKEMPDAYAYTEATLPGVLSRMEEAFRTGAYNHTNSPAIKRTCKDLGLRYVRKEIEAFLRKEES